MHTFRNDGAFTLWSHKGTLDFEIDAEPWVSGLRTMRTTPMGHHLIQVQTITLDDYFAPLSRKPSLLNRPGRSGVASPGTRESASHGGATITFEYSPRNARQFGYDAVRILELLANLNYSIFAPGGRKSWLRSNGSPGLSNAGRQGTSWPRQPASPWCMRSISVGGNLPGIRNKANAIFRN